MEKDELSLKEKVDKIIEELKEVPQGFEGISWIEEKEKERPVKVPFSNKDLLKALSSDTRVKILELSSYVPATTTLLAEYFNMSKAGINKHLKILKKVGLIKLVAEEGKPGPPKRVFLSEKIFSPDLEIPLSIPYYPELKDLVNAYRKTVDTRPPSEEEWKTANGRQMTTIDLLELEFSEKIPESIGEFELWRRNIWTILRWCFVYEKLFIEKKPITKDRKDISTSSPVEEKYIPRLYPEFILFEYLIKKMNADFCRLGLKIISEYKSQIPDLPKDKAKQLVDLKNKLIKLLEDGLEKARKKREEEENKWLKGVRGDRTEEWGKTIKKLVSTLKSARFVNDSLASFEISSSQGKGEERKGGEQAK